MKRITSWVLAGLTMALLVVSTAPAFASQATVTLAVSGMTWGVSCSQRVQSTLSHLDGVINAQVNFDEKTATVSYDPARTQPDKIAEGLSTATSGKYTAKVKS